MEHIYYLNGSQIVAEEWSDKLLVYLYDASGSPIGMMFRKTSYAADQWDVYWFTKNLQGDIVAVYNSSGQQVATYSYNDAWGNHTTYYTNGGGSTGAQYNPFRYRGYYYDTDLGMYYLQSRYYDAKICRFINADGYASTGQGLIGNNMFAYCGNNPVNYVDYSGEFALPFAIPVEYVVLLGLLAVGMTVLIADATGEQVLGNFFSGVIIRTADALNCIANLFEVDTSKDDANDIITSPNNNVVFPEDPFNFNPIGLERVYKDGTKNGAVIYWQNPITREVVFRWDENTNHDNGPHYHILKDPLYNDVHFYTGMPVPEPYATRYFPAR